VQKELNPLLFGENAQKSRLVEKSMPNAQFEQKITDTKQQIQGVTEALQRIVHQMNDYMKTNQAKMERVHTALLKLEANDESLATETMEKMNQLNARVGERKAMDAKVQELIDRQNNILRTFEVRLSHLQMLLNEKDAQLVSSQAALNEAKMEIARLKRM
jgi:chromosome segregation ATPase